MLTDLREAIGVGIHEAIHKQNNPEVMMFTVKTIKGAGVAELLLQLIQDGSYEIYSGVTLKVGKRVSVSFNRGPDSIELDFMPPPVIKAKVLGISYTIKLEAATVKKDELYLILQGFKDLRIGLE